MDPRGILKAFPKRKKIHTNSPSKALAKIPKREHGEAAGGEQTHLRTLMCLNPQDSYVVHVQNQMLELTLPTQGLQVCLYLPCNRLGPQSLTGCWLGYLLPHPKTSITQKILLGP